LLPPPIIERLGHVGLHPHADQIARKGRTLRKFGVKAPRLEAYFRAHPEYARAARPLIAANSKAAARKKGAHIRNKTHCVSGHSLAEHGRVAIHKGWMTRQCRACERMRYERGDVFCEALARIERIGACLALAQSIARLSA
jgi:hypothetical protein